ncbi:hypothetical protein QJQ45_015187, partial [Haematococcus lacustris]
QANRLRLHQMMKEAGPHFDVKLSAALNCVPSVAARLQPLGGYLPLEANNQATVILDVDGNGWSDRFARLMHYNTPILKQASKFHAFFEHLVDPGLAIELFANDLSDTKGEALLKEWLGSKQRLQEEVRQRQGLALHLLNQGLTLVLRQVAVVEAMAYALNVYASKLTWAPGVELGFEAVPWSLACQQNSMMPREMCSAAAARSAPSMQQELRWAILVCYSFVDGALCHAISSIFTQPCPGVDG